MNRYSDHTKIQKYKEVAYVLYEFWLQASLDVDIVMLRL